MSISINQDRRILNNSTKASGCDTSAAMGAIKKAARVNYTNRFSRKGNFIAGSLFE